ncbi:MAG TPA: saccharopine dehydrogenase NADP-binding domain-containing protein [Casimicrobiaceae bacterium]|jgi:saccharopine dehydrogenase-like NADP-dependent oxidoreductase
MAFRVVVLGGYGHFGARIARTLARDAGMEVTVVGREPARAVDTAAAIALDCGNRVDAAAFDVTARDIGARLRSLEPNLVIHTCGPFQSRDHGVARAALSVGAHYVDLADARKFVCGIGAIDDAARSRELLVVSGASTVPGVSGAVIDAFAHEFDALQSIDFGIAPGNRTPRGSATIASVASYVGRQFGVWDAGVWQPAYGWQRLRSHRYPPEVGTRWLADCDVPDLELFPERYPGVQSVRFGAGLELPFLHFGLWLLSWPSRWRWISRLEAHSERLRRSSEWFAKLGTDVGAMHVEMHGFRRGHRLDVLWTLVAGHGDGPQIPCTPAIVIARKLAAGTLVARGALPCVGLFSLEECLRELEGYDVRTIIERTLI